MAVDYVLVDALEFVPGEFNAWNIESGLAAQICDGQSVTSIL